MENHNTHLAPGFTLNYLVPAPGNVAVLWGLLGPGGLIASTKCPSSSGTASPRVAQAPPGSHSLPGDLPFPPEHYQVSSCRFADFVLPLFTVLMEFIPSPFSLLPFKFSPCGCFQFSTFSLATFGEGCFSCILPTISILSSQA